MFYLTDTRDQPLDSLRPLSVDTVDSAESISQSSTLTYNGKAAAGAISMCSLPFRNVLNPLGTKHGSYWGDPENLVYTRNFGNGLSSIVETASSATCTLVDPNNDLELMFESLTGTVKRYVLKVTDASGFSLYGWIYLVAKSGNTYTLDVVNNRVTQTQSWVGNLSNFDSTKMTKVEIFKYESSLSFGTGTTFTEEVSPPSRDGMTWKEALEEATTLSNGQFFFDYRNAIAVGKRADTTASETVTYIIEVATVGGAVGGGLSSENISQVGGVAVPTSGADAVSNTQSGVPTYSRIEGFNGSTWDRIRSGVSAISTTITGWLNCLPGIIYNASPTVRTEGQVGLIQGDSNGFPFFNLGVKLDRTNDEVGVVLAAPYTGTTGSYTSVFSSALEASHVLKASAGKIFKGTVRVDSTLGSGTYYIQLINATSLPSNGGVTFLMNPIKVIHTSGTDDFVDFDFVLNGLPASTGAVVAISTTEFTLTVGSSVLSLGFLTN